ncbi:MAG: exodeoxyribonuclease VII large subunit [Chloroflexi bacterium]|nr:exodeoxyribonuclease VII large subunit [Chloroflexota bacterium]
MGFFAGRQLNQSETWTVASLTAYIREMFEVDYRLQDVEVSGELSNFTRARSGHLYFTLKDAEAQRNASCGARRRSGCLCPRRGDAVVAEGRVSVYEAGGNYQLYVERMQPAGRGNLAWRFEQLKTAVGR